MIQRIIDAEFAAGVRPGLRERQKTERRRRIINAARAVFRERGFDDATTAEIAKEAGVGPGTLFRYVRDKHELLWLVLHDELDVATETGFAAMMNTRASLVTRLLKLYRPRFEFWGADLGLARSASAPMYGGRVSPDKRQFARIGRHEEQTLSKIADVVATHAQKAGLTPRKDVAVIARTIHHLYIGSLRTWINEAEPDIEAAITDLQQQFTLLIEGIFAPAT